MRRELEESLEALSAIVMGPLSLVETLTEVTQLAARAIPGADGVGLTLLEGQEAGVMAVSDDFVRTVDEVQHRLGEGPCLFAARAGTTQVCGSLGGERRWRRFGPRAGRLGVHSALALPLIVAGQTIGTLNAYGRSRDAFDEWSVRCGEEYSVAAAVTVANARALEESRRLAGHFERALTSRTVIDQAIGIVMSRRGCTGEEAFDVLRATSQSTGSKVAEVAGKLVDEAIARARARHRSGPAP